VVFLSAVFFFRGFFVCDFFNLLPRKINISTKPNETNNSQSGYVSTWQHYTSFKAAADDHGVGAFRR